MKTLARWIVGIIYLVLLALVFGIVSAALGLGTEGGPPNPLLLIVCFGIYYGTVGKVTGALGLAKTPAPTPAPTK